MQLSRHTLTCLTAAVLLAACGPEDDGATDPEADTSATEDGAIEADPNQGETGTDDGADDGTDEAANDGTDDAADDAPDSETTDQTSSTADDDLVDISTAQPGTWPVGDAGTVTFDVVDGALTLEGYEAAEGWEATVDEEEADDIEVDFTRDDVTWEFEVELDDGDLEIELRQDHLDAAAGSYDLLDGGSFAFEANGRLTLTDLSPGDGWQVTEQEQESEEIEFTLREGDRDLDVEVELDDGRIDIEIDYEVSGPAPS